MDDTFSVSTQDERQANAFAAAFLMPETRVRTMIDSYVLGPESLARMLYEFGISFQSLIFRLHNLRIVNSALRDQLQAAGWQGLLNVTARSDLRERLGPEISAARTGRRLSTTR